MTIFWRLVLAVLGVVALALAVTAGLRGGPLAWLLLVVFLAGPDLTMLIHDSRPTVKGQMSPRAVPYYNAAHRLWAATALLVAGAFLLAAIGLVPVMVGGLAWFGHVAIDRALGFGLRAPEGFQRG
ncbi:MAG: DUF4260 family protein [bacterium]|jgi:hypothetical protein|nr:DUF4260 family protein [bacterium]